MIICRKKSNPEYKILITLILVLLFQDVISNYIKPFQYFDEVLAVLFFFFILIKRIRIINKITVRFILLLGVLIIDGIIGFEINAAQPIAAVLGDLVLVLKFYLCYGLSNILFSYNKLIEKEKTIQRCVFFLSICLALLTLLNYIFKIWTFEYRYGIMSNRLFFEHPSLLASASFVLIALNIAFSFNNRIRNISIALLSIVLLSTLRTTAIGAAFISLMIAFYIKKTKKKITISKFTFLGIIAAMIAWNQISYYFILLDGSARRQLLLKSIEIAKDYFPIGTGFGSYGSYMSSVYYSHIYYDYGLNNIWGLSPEKTSFITDSYWPMILGQFGVIGVVIVVILLIMIFNNIQSQFKTKNMKLYTCKIVCFAYLLISSIGSSAYVNPIAIPFAIILGIL